jgi:hypothetical protein
MLLACFFCKNAHLKVQLKEKISGIFAGKTSIALVAIEQIKKHS